MASLAETPSKSDPPLAEGNGAAASPSPLEKARKRRLVYRILGAVTVVVAGAFGVFALVTANRVTSDDAEVGSDVVPLAAQVGGKVVKVNVHENQRVTPGMVVLQLDPADFQARELEAQASVAIAEAQVRAADAQVSVVEALAHGGRLSARAAVSGSGDAVFGADAAIAGAKAGVVGREADLRLAETDLHRTRELFEASAVPKEKLQNAQIEVELARASVESAEAQLTAAQEEQRGASARVKEARGRLDQSAPVVSAIAVARAQASVAQAGLAKSKAALELAKSQLSYATVTAPGSGVISELGVREGQLILAGQPIADLVPNETYLLANFKETQVGRIRAGQRVEATVDAFPGIRLHGRVQSLSGGTASRFALFPPDNASGNFVDVVQRVPVRIAWVNLPKDLDLRAGLSCEATVYLK